MNAPDRRVELGASLVRPDPVTDAAALPGAMGAELLVASTPMSAVAEAVRTLRAQLALRWREQRQTQFIGIVSAVRGEGRSFIAANLAVAFAQLHERTLLIDLDLRHARQHRIFGLDPTQGLSSLQRDGGAADISPIEGCPTLSVLPAGPPSRQPQELITARVLAPLLDQARRRFDVVIIDTPADACGADAQIVSAQAGQALLVSAPGMASRDETSRLLSALRQVGVAVVGAAMNRR
jgi:protein-tyrosine kinase